MRTDEALDRVDEAGDESFPASDPPAWIPGSASHEAPVWRRPGWIGRTLREGLVAGLAGYLAVVLVVAILDLAGGHAAFHTAELLGTAIFGGGGDAVWGPVYAWNGVHLLASLVVATIGAAMVLASERLRGFWYLALMALITVAVWAIGALGLLGVEFTGLVEWSTVVLATFAWLAAMTATFAVAHRRLFRRMGAEMDSEG